MKNLLIGQSGGPTAVINASLAGVIQRGLNQPEIETVYGSVHGVEGILSENFLSLEDFRDPEKLEILKQTPAAYLGSCRKKLPSREENEALYQEIFRIFEKHNIGYFAYIGGNDSMDTVLQLSDYAKEKQIDVKVVGIPKTIDNDLFLTDHTPGYGSAAKFVANSVKQLACDGDVYDLPSVLVVEIMGRNAGWLTAAAALANTETKTYVDLIALPEVPFSFDALVAETRRCLAEKNTVVIALSEGIKDENGAYIGESLASKAREGQDSFQHAILGGVGRIVETCLADALNVKTRTIEFSTLQRCAATEASLCDVEEAFQAGYQGLGFAIDGQTGIMAGFKRLEQDSYQCEVVPLEIHKVANFEKKMPLSMIQGFTVTQEYLDYARPLITGEPKRIYQDGILETISK